MSTVTILDLSSDLEVNVTAAEICQRFERDGVIVLPHFFAKPELARVRNEMETYYAPFQMDTSENSPSKREDRQKYACDVISWDPVTKGNAAFKELASNSRLAEVTEAVLGAGFTSPGSLIMFSVGGGRGQAWHQDCPPGEDQGFNLNRLIYTDDITLEDGAIVFVPGSHRLGRIPPGDHQAFMEGEIALSPQAGTLVLLHGHVYHRVTPNLNMKPRVSVNFRAFPAGVSPDVTCIGIYRNGSVNFCDKPKNHDGTEAAMTPASR